MVFKKPYAFLIKHFRAFHLVLAAISIFLAFEINNLVKFFRQFAASGYYSVSSNLAGSYINFFMYLSVVLILGITIFIYLLMRNKKKSTKFYVALIIYYIILFILLTISYGILQNLEKSVIDVQMTRVYRDLSLILSLPQYFFIIYDLIRGLGFDLKKFNFQADLKELEIEASDSEEVELTVGIETYKAKRYIRRFIREFKYYILENTFIFICLLSIVGIILGTAIFMNVNVYNKVYKENKVFTYKTFNIKVNRSYLTDKDYSGKEIIEGKSYLILDINVVNKAQGAREMNLSDFRLKINNTDIYPTASKVNYFRDLGTTYSGTKIPALSDNNYLLVYEISNDNIRSNYYIKILDSITYNVGDIKAKYKEVKVSPQNLSEIENMGTYKLKESIGLEDSILKNSTIAINEYNVTNSYKYNYEFCITSDNCQDSVGIITPNYTKMSNSTLLVLDYVLVLDDSVSLNQTFFTQFCRLKYIIGEKETIAKTNNLTPSNLTNKVVLQVDNKIREADKVQLLITIRNKEYIVNIK